MSDYIDREAALDIDVDIEVENESDIDLIMRGMRLYMEYIKGIPSAGQIRPLANGEWLYDTTTDMFACSLCDGLAARNVYSYCPWCGADMRK